MVFVGVNLIDDDGLAEIGLELGFDVIIGVDDNTGEAVGLTENVGLKLGLFFGAGLGVLLVAVSLFVVVEITFDNVPAVDIGVGDAVEVVE